MKRRDLERRLRIAGCYLKREGTSHSLWINPKNGIMEAVPRHIEIKEPLAKKDFEESECRMKTRAFDFRGRSLRSQFSAAKRREDLAKIKPLD
jgi:mRNA interferase HicA